MPWEREKRKHRNLTYSFLLLTSLSPKQQQCGVCVCCGSRITNNWSCPARRSRMWSRGRPPSCEPASIRKSRRPKRMGMRCVHIYLYKILPNISNIYYYCVVWDNVKNNNYYNIKNTLNSALTRGRPRNTNKKGYLQGLKALQKDIDLNICAPCSKFQ